MSNSSQAEKVHKQRMYEKSQYHMQMFCKNVCVWCIIINAHEGFLLAVKSKSFNQENAFSSEFQQLLNYSILYTHYLLYIILQMFRYTSSPINFIQILGFICLYGSNVYL